MLEGGGVGLRRPWQEGAGLRRPWQSGGACGAPAGEGGACGAPVEEGRGAREDPRCALFLSRAPSGRPPADPGWGASRPRRRRDAVERTPLQLRGPRSFSGGRVSVTFISGPTAGF